MKRFLVIVFLLVCLPTLAQETFLTISHDTINQIEELEVFGNGRITNKLVYSPDGEMIAVAGSMGVWVYEASNLEIEPDFIAIGHNITDLDYSPDGQILAIATDTSLIFWDLVSNSISTQWNDAMYRVAFSPDNHLIATVSRVDTSHEEYGQFYNDVIHIRERDTGQILSVLSFYSKAGTTVESLQFSPDGQWLAGIATPTSSEICIRRNPLLNIWNIQDTIEQVTVTSAPYEFLGIQSLFFHPDGHTLVMHDYNDGWGDSISLWDMETNAPTLAEHINIESDTTRYGTIYTIALHPDGSQIAAYRYLDGGNSPTPSIVLWETASGEQIREQPINFHLWDNIIFSPSGNQIASIGNADNDRQGTPYLWTWETTSNSIQFVQPEQPLFLSNTVKQKVWSPNNEYIYYATDTLVGRFNLADGSDAVLYEGSKVAINGLGTIAAIHTNNIILYSLNDNNSTTLEQEFAEITDIVLSDNGLYLLTSQHRPEVGTYSVTVWETQTLSIVNSFEHSHPATYEFSHNNEYFVISEAEFDVNKGFINQNTTVYDVSTADVIVTLDGRLAHFSRDDTILWYQYETSTASGLRTGIKAWNLQTATHYISSDDRIPFDYEFHLAVYKPSPNNRYIAYSGSLSWSGLGCFTALTIKNVETRQETQIGVGFGDWQFLSGDTLMFAFAQPNIIVWDIETQQIIEELAGHTLYSGELLFSADEHLLVSFGADGTIRVWGIPS